MVKSDKGLNISNPLLMLKLQNDQPTTHFILGDLYKVLIWDNMKLPWSLGGPHVEEKSAILNKRMVSNSIMLTAN